MSRGLMTSPMTSRRAYRPCRATVTARRRWAPSGQQRDRETWRGRGRTGAVTRAQPPSGDVIGLGGDVTGSPGDVTALPRLRTTRKDTSSRSGAEGFWDGGETHESQYKPV